MLERLGFHAWDPTVTGELCWCGTEAPCCPRAGALAWALWEVCPHGGGWAEATFKSSVSFSCWLFWNDPSPLFFFNHCFVPHTVCHTLVIWSSQLTSLRRHSCVAPPPFLWASDFHCCVFIVHGPVSLQAFHAAQCCALCTCFAGEETEAQHDESGAPLEVKAQPPGAGSRLRRVGPGIALRSSGSVASTFTAEPSPRPLNACSLRFRACRALSQALAGGLGV